MIVLEKRPNPSRDLGAADAGAGGARDDGRRRLLFWALGKDPFVAIRTIFWDPIFGDFASFTRPQLLIKAGPLILIAVGLSFGFRAGIWNIGAEGQYILGALTGGGSGARLSTRPRRGGSFR
jgi:simple sugar transport system permease protein